MFEISGNDIAHLGDDDLRSLVERLAIAELRKNGCPRSSVTAGGNQDAPDGGVDVRVECPVEIGNPDFVPRKLTGFQVKKPDMPPADINKEMRPKGVLRDAIRKLADGSGAYVIVSAQGSVTDKPLADRRKAMRDALTDVPNAEKLQTDFYDRNRLATWVNEYPGIAAWVRARIGKPLSGWLSINDWEGSSSSPKSYLADDKACIIDENAKGHTRLRVMDGIDRLRGELRKPGKCIRLVGMSGLGKTRLVRALFEEGVGEEPLDPGLAVYTDYSEETQPKARDMARGLITQGQRAILIVDNCNPATHKKLAELCACDASPVSLITVEYDVSDDTHEDTDVFRLQQPSSELVAKWLKQEFPEISETDRSTISKFSDGNFRIARALAKTLGKEETLGRLRDKDLFERIFRQRNDPDQQLLRAAEYLSLLYSINGEDMSDEGELVHISTLSSTTANDLYEALEEMRRREVVQARGYFRAVLPQAIANPLAIRAIERLHPSRFDAFCGGLTARMLKSMSRRLGLLHDSSAAHGVVARWLKDDGPVGNLMAMNEDGFEIITNIAPAAPTAVLTKLENGIDGPNRIQILGTRNHHLVGLIKSLAYEADQFERSTLLLARFLGAEPEGNNYNSARSPFTELFHITLSGTLATPAQRRIVIKLLAASEDEGLRRCVPLALEALLESGHFMSMGDNDFGARPRDWGWEPEFHRDIREWFEEAVDLAVELLPEAEARMLVADNVWRLCANVGYLEAIDRAATVFAQTRPWIEGWTACCSALRHDGKDMVEGDRVKLAQLIGRLEPKDLLNRARAIIINPMPGGDDLAEDEEDLPSVASAKVDKMAKQIGRLLANEATIRAGFIAELVSTRDALRAFECGQGLAEGTNDLESMWAELTKAYGLVPPGARNGTVFSGFIAAAHQRDPSFTSGVLEASIYNSDLLPILPDLQRRSGLDSEGIVRLRRAIAEGSMSARSFLSIANGSVSHSPSDELAALLESIATLPEGAEIALHILPMHLSTEDQKEGTQPSAQLTSAIRNLIAQVSFDKHSLQLDLDLANAIKLSLIGDDGQEVAKKVCANIRLKLDRPTFIQRPNHTLDALFETQPLIVLDALLQPTVIRQVDDLFGVHRGQKAPVEKLDPAILHEWSNRDPHSRYPLLGQFLSIFAKNDREDSPISSLFLSMLDQAPDKRLFLGDLISRLRREMWVAGSRSNMLSHRKADLLKLVERGDEEVRAFIIGLMPEIDAMIEQEHEVKSMRIRSSEESFE